MTIITVTLNTSVDRTLEVPRLVPGGHLKGRLLRLQPGGKGVNVSRCLAGLGVPSVITGLVGSSEAGLFRDSFAGSAARVDLVPTAQPTRTCTTLLDPELGTDTHIREQGSTPTSGEIEALRLKLHDLASHDALVVFCGSLAPGMSDAHLAELLAACQAKGAQIAGDLNGPQLAVAVAARAVLVKPNVEELGECLGRDLHGAAEGELVAAARSLLDRVGTVLVTRGQDGALALRRGEELAGSVEVASPRNTVGCGDAFLAGYLAGLWRSMAFGEGLCLAVACGAAQALAEAPGRMSATQVQQLAARVRVRGLSGCRPLG